MWRRRSHCIDMHSVKGFEPCSVQAWLYLPPLLWTGYGPIGYEGMREAVLFFYFTKSCIVSFFWIAFFPQQKSILVSQTHPVWILQIGFLQTSLTPLWPIRVEFKPCHSPQKKRENLTTLVLCLMKMCFHVLRHFFSFSLLVKEVPWFKKRERKEIDQAR